jgi:hypothetical protein
MARLKSNAPKINGKMISGRIKAISKVLAPCSFFSLFSVIVPFPPISLLGSQPNFRLAPKRHAWEKT